LYYKLNGDFKNIFKKMGLQVSNMYFSLKKLKKDRKMYGSFAVGTETNLK